MSERAKIGAHVSVAGGLYKGFANAQNIGAECIQIFGASPRGWQAKMPSDEDVERYKAAQKESGVGPVFLHAAYLVNLGAADEMMRTKSVASLTAHLNIAEAIGAQGLIFHVGSGATSSKEEAIREAIIGMKQVLKNVPGNTQFIMENAAGGGSKLGATPEEMATMMHGVSSPRMKICIDTAHAFEAGLIEAYTPENITVFLDAWDKDVGVSNIVALHANDSKTEFNSHHDRHENIGQGHIGLEGFKSMAREKRLQDKCWLLEVPGFANEGPDKKNIDILRSCFK